MTVTLSATVDPDASADADVRIVGVVRDVVARGLSAADVHRGLLKLRADTLWQQDDVARRVLAAYDHVQIFGDPSRSSRRSRRTWTGSPRRRTA